MNYITRSPAGIISKLSAPSDDIAIAKLAGTDHERLHRCGTVRERGACRPVWRLEIDATGVMRQHAANACARRRGGNGEAVSSAVVTQRPLEV